MFFCVLCIEVNSAVFLSLPQFQVLAGNFCLEVQEYWNMPLEPYEKFYTRSLKR